MSMKKVRLAIKKISLGVTAQRWAFEDPSAEEQRKTAHRPNDAAFLEHFKSMKLRFDVELLQPPLGFLKSIDCIQDSLPKGNIDELIAATKFDFGHYPPYLMIS